MEILTVTQLNGYVKGLLEEDMLLGDVYVSGEISNLKRHSSGHVYFSLKDSGGAVSAAMFKWQARYLKFAPADGMRIIAHGKVTLYEPSGQYQMIVASMQPDGVGALYAAYEKLKRRLEAEGLFAPERKKPLPKMPERVGIVTSKTGAAVQDIINIISRRFPLCELLLAPVQVQGAAAPAEIAAAIERFNAQNACDVMIVGRGGGSIEDLWSFNDEAVVRAVAASGIPVVSAVGHETDFTLCDFAADMRAPTPSAAAELAVPDAAELQKLIDGLKRRSFSAVASAAVRQSERLDRASKRRCFRSPELLIEAKTQRFDMAVTRLRTAGVAALVKPGKQLAACASKLAALDPLAVLKRGYAIIEKDGGVASSAAELQSGERVSIRFGDGKKEADIV